ncbi:cytochrome c-type biogenesis protein [Thalassobacillus cyri]|uniref:Cytochrome c-type biogenesis protein n=1 Tax=Thalassobacillus cyri TaxID=571932 RepID=A0A1H3X5M3_9BACI|nr:cytochrome c biogenesis protein CcdA [Thalassobacillus cyri]SDZ93932.1 cytochrome c-type biogenesis protein [Thalassobacillus cyri]
MTSDVTIWLAFGAGAISFLSPCTLPLLPAYLSYITGMSVKEIQDKKDAKVRTNILLHSIFFLIGVSSIFIALGIGASFLGSYIQGLLSGQSGLLIQRIAGVFIILMGLFVGGWVSFKWLMKDKRLRSTQKPAGLLGTAFVGMGFAAGWTPCIGPIFASILVLAATDPTQGLVYTIMYVLGFALPFLLFSFFLGSARWVLRYSEKIMKVGGGVMIIMGVLLYTGQMARLSNMILRLVQDTWLGNLG